MRHKLAAGNWKMNGLSGDLAEIEALIAAHPAPKVEMLICPPATLLSRMADTVGDHPLHLGGQDCHAAPDGANTGDISAAMLVDAGARYVGFVFFPKSPRHLEIPDAAALAAAVPFGVCKVALGTLAVLFKLHAVAVILAVLSQQDQRGSV